MSGVSWESNLYIINEERIRPIVNIFRLKIYDNLLTVLIFLELAGCLAVLNQMLGEWYVLIFIECDGLS